MLNPPAPRGVTVEAKGDADGPGKILRRSASSSCAVPLQLTPYGSRLLATSLMHHAS